MHDLVSQGKVMYWGTSEWTARQIRTAFKVTAENGLHPPVAEQPPYNMFNRNRYEYQTQPIVKRMNLGVLSTTPLSSGVLSGKYLAGGSPRARLNMPENAWLRDRLGSAFSEESTNTLKKVQQLARNIKATPAQVAIAWCLLNPTITSVITGASNMQQLRENLATTEVLRNLDNESLNDLKNLVAKAPLAHAFDWLKIRSRPARQAARSLLGR
jgi:aryl-alcohol dehydrogenase-like predicted oxidoreductase